MVGAIIVGIGQYIMVGYTLTIEQLLKFSIFLLTSSVNPDYLLSDWQFIGISDRYMLSRREASFCSHATYFNANDDIQWYVHKVRFTYSLARLDSIYFSF